MESITGFFKDIFIWLYQQLQELIQWVLDGLEYLAIDLLIAPVLRAVAYLLESIPLPSWYNMGTVNLGSAGYFIAIAEVPAGVTMIISAYTIRFLIRRIPFIG